MSERNIQTIVGAETHRELREAAYEYGIPLRDLVRDILTQYARQRTTKATAKQGESHE